MRATSLHFKVQNISRGGGKKATAAAAYRSGSQLRHQPSAVARAAYRSGERLHDAQIDKTFDFRRKERVDYAAIHTHDHRPAWAIEREPVWNGVEAIERRKDARLAKDITAALPRDLSLKQHIALVEEFVTQEFVSRGLIADVAIHNKKARDGGENPHVHIMITTRPITPEGFGKKDRDLDKQETLEAWRKSYEAICNRHLEEAGSTQRVSLDSFKTRGIDEEPLIRLDREAWRKEQKGILTEQGDINRDIRHVNHLRKVMHRMELDVEVPPELSDRIEQHKKPRRRRTGPPEKSARKDLREIAAEQAAETQSHAPSSHAATVGDRVALTRKEATGETSHTPRGSTSAETALAAKVEAYHHQRVEALTRNLAAPVVRARLAVSRQIHRLRQWWTEKRQEYAQEPARRESSIDRLSRDNLATPARDQRKTREREHER